MNIGKLRHVIRIQKRVGNQDDDTGAMTYRWVNFKKVRASIEPLSVREFIQSDATQSEIQARIVIRHVKGLMPTMRIVHQCCNDQSIYNPKGFLNDPKSGKHYITIPCSLGVNDGE